jgi:hypothetical protein
VALLSRLGLVVGEVVAWAGIEVAVRVANHRMRAKPGEPHGVLEPSRKLE